MGNLWKFKPLCGPSRVKHNLPSSRPISKNSSIEAPDHPFDNCTCCDIVNILPIRHKTFLCHNKVLADLTSQCAPVIFSAIYKPRQVCKTHLGKSRKGNPIRVVKCYDRRNLAENALPHSSPLHQKQHHMHTSFLCFDSARDQDSPCSCLDPAQLPPVDAGQSVLYVAA